MKRPPVLLFHIKLNRSLFALILIILILLGMLPGKASAQESIFDCAQSTIEVSPPDSAFQMVLPAYLMRTTDLDPDARLRFKNTFHETYLLVYEENLDSDARQGEQMFFNHCTFVNKLYNEGAVKENAAEIEVNGNHASQYEIKLMVDGVDLSYVVTFIETRDKFFKIYFWTLSRQKETFFPDFKKSVNSFFTETRVN